MEPDVVDQNEPLDPSDLSLLAEWRAVCERLDPMPPGLPDAVKFALAVRLLQAEAAAIVQDAALPVRAVTPAAARSVAFGSRSVDLLISASDEPDDTLRLDGWVTPVGVRIEVYGDPDSPRLDGSTPTATVDADELGRFVLRGLRQRRLMLVVRNADPTLPPTVTPIVEF